MDYAHVCTCLKVCLWRSDFTDDKNNHQRNIKLLCGYETKFTKYLGIFLLVVYVSAVAAAVAHFFSLLLLLLLHFCCWPPCCTSVGGDGGVLHTKLTVLQFFFCIVTISHGSHRLVQAFTFDSMYFFVSVRDTHTVCTSNLSSVPHAKYSFTRLDYIISQVWVCFFISSPPSPSVSFSHLYILPTWNIFHYTFNWPVNFSLAASKFTLHQLVYVDVCKWVLSTDLNWSDTFWQIVCNAFHLRFVICHISICAHKRKYHSPIRSSCIFFKELKTKCEN